MCGSPLWYSTLRYSYVHTKNIACIQISLCVYIYLMVYRYSYCYGKKVAYSNIPLFVPYILMAYVYPCVCAQNLVSTQLSYPVPVLTLGISLSCVCLGKIHLCMFLHIVLWCIQKVRPISSEIKRSLGTILSLRDVISCATAYIRVIDIYKVFLYFLPCLAFCHKFLPIILG